ncbi:MAG: glucokinase [Acidobacteria bacterium]|nr:glucokinase [Acidobacteriota bacterium]MCA1641442.1 glucokinase [Acidobacteriota bacterium]
MILAGDIGGTKTNLALFEARDGNLSAPRAQASFASAGYETPEAILREYLAGQPRVRVETACFGVAGPVVSDEVSATNLAWKVARSSLSDALGVSRVHLINDLEATAYGIDALAPHQLFTLNEGTGEAVGNRALIAAGTGLGTSAIFWDGARYRPVPSEGGHVDFAPRNETEVGLFRHLQKRFGAHISYERVLSGPGLVNVYEFLRDAGQFKESELLTDEIARAGDAAAVVSAAALAGRSELCVRALDLFVDVYGAAAGNLALLLKATGGLYVGGGIAPKILDKLKDGAFVRAFSEKGRMSGLAASFPVRVILDEKTALYGAARYAQQRQAV